MSYLTKAVRENMRKTVLDHAFKEREDAAQAELVAAGEALYMAHHEQYLPIMAQLPKDFLYGSKRMDASIGGQSHHIVFEERKPMSYQSSNGYIPFDANDPVAIAYLQSVRKVDDIKNERNTMRNKVTAILESVRTFKKLWEVWPEAKLLLEKFEDKPPVAYLPAIQFDQINAQLGLPPATNEIPWTHRMKTSGGYEIGYFGAEGFIKTYDDVGSLETAKSIVEGHNAAKWFK